MTKDINLKLYIVFIILIVFLAFFVRIYDIESFPPGIYPDEAVNGMDAVNANESHNWKAFYENNNGREGLFINLIALGFGLFGVSIITLKIWSILFGTFTVLGMIFLGEKLFKSRRAGITAGFLTATSFWAINFSRIGFRAIMLPFVLVWSFFFLIRGIQNKKISDYIFAGIFFGLGLHTYISFRIAPLILIALLIASVLSYKKFLIIHWKGIISFCIATIIISSPMLIDFYNHPEHFSGRTDQVSVFNPEINKGNLPLTLGKSFGLTLIQFNFWGDQNWRHNLPAWPEIFPTIGIFFLVGIIYFIFDFFRLLWKRIYKGERNKRFVLVSLILSWFFVMILPSAISFEGLPHALRSIGTMPVALLLAVFSLEAVFKWSEKIEKENYKRIIWILLIIIIIGSGFWTVKMYFIDWGKSVEVHSAFDEKYMNMSNYINGLPKENFKYVIDNGPGIQMEDGLQASAEVVKLFTYQKTNNVIFIKPDFEFDTIKMPAKIFLMKYDEVLISHIQGEFSQSIIVKVDNQPEFGTDFIFIDIKLK